MPADSYLVAVAATAVAMLLRWLLDPWLGDDLLFITLYGAVATAVWYGGYRPALVAVAVGYLACTYLFIESPGTIALQQPSHLIGIVLYLFTCSLIIGFGEAMRVARRRAESSRQEALDKQKQLEREVAERQQAEDELRRAEEQTRSVVETVFSGIVTIDERGVVQSFNPAAERLFGYAASEVVGRNVKMLMPEPYCLGHDDYIADYLRTSAAKVIGIGREVEGRRKDGSTFPMDLAISEFRLGERRYFTGIVRDITDRKRAEEEVRRLNEELRGRVDELQTVLQVLPIGVAMAHDPACRHMTLNSHMSELLGVPVGANASLSAPPGERPTSYTNCRDGQVIPPEELPMQVACTGAEVRDFEVDLVRVGRATRKLLCFARPLHDGEGRVRGSVGAFLDITELKKVEQALKEADRRKDEFLATLAHELRNPLAPVWSAVEMLRRSGSNDRLVERARSILERQVSQIVRLVDDLLDVARIARGKLELRRQRVELAVVVNNAVEASRPLIDQMGHELTVTLPPQPVHLDIDPVRIGQVLLNLLNNAAKYTERGGRIRLTAKRHGSDVVLMVKDTGVGIPADKLPHIFEMFTQVEGSLGRAQGGLGLGLTLVKRLAQMHGGSVEVRSDGPGTGSEFTVRLPVVTSPGTDESAPGEVKTTPVSCRILIVDDNVDGADSMAELLRTLGNQVMTVYDGTEAVQAVATFRPDVVLLDIGLPRLNGYEVASRIRREPRGERTILIAVTGWGQEEDRRRAQEAGFNCHMVKPVEPRSLMKLLARLLPTPTHVPS